MRRPWRVTYGFDPADARRGLGLSRDGAYWVSGLRPRDRKLPAAIDARSLATGERDPEIVSVDGTRVGGGGFPADFTVGEGVPSPTLDIRGTAWEPSERVAARPVLRLQLANLRHVRIDPRGARLPRRYRLRIESDGPATVRVGDRTVRVSPG